MATKTAEFALSMKDDISASSESAEDSLKSLQSQIDKDSKALSEMRKAMRQMQAAGSVDISAYRKLKEQIDETQESIGKARAAFVNLGGEFGKIKKKKKIIPPVEKPKELGEMLSAVNALPSPLARASKGVGGMRSVVTGLNAALGVTLAAVVAVIAIMAAFVAAIVAVTAATAKATVELLKYAAAQSDAARSERLRLEGLGTLRRWMRLTGKDAAQMSESINRVSERVPLARSVIAGYGSELHRLGIRGRAAEDALEALSMAQAVQGDLGRRRLMMLVRMAGHSEGAMANLAARVRKELGGVAMQQMMSLTMISTKLKESFEALFTGLNIGRLLSGLYRLSRLLSQSTESGRALKAIFTNVLGVFVGELANTVGPIEFLFKEIIILALKVAIAFFKIKLTIDKVFGRNIIARFLMAGLTLKNIKIVLIALGIVLGIVAAAVVFLGFVVAGIITPFVLIALAIYHAYQEGKKLIATITLVYNAFSKIDWSEVGTNIIDGIIGGLESGVTRLRNAVTGVASQAMTSFRDSLGIRSPSRVFAQFGLAIPQGITAGIERGGDQATRAASNLITSTSAPGAVTTTSSRSVQIGDIHIHLGPGSDEDTADRVVDSLEDFFNNAFAMENI